MYSVEQIIKMMCHLVVFHFTAGPFMDQEAERHV